MYTADSPNTIRIDPKMRTMEKENIEDRLFSEAQKLSIEQKARLVSMLMGDPEQVTFNIGNASTQADTVYQINLNNTSQVADVLEAIADKLRREKETEDY